MTTKRVDQYSTATPADADQLVGIDASDTTDSAAGTVKRYTLSALLTYLADTFQTFSTELSALSFLNTTGVVQRTGPGTYAAGNITEGSVTNLVSDLAAKAPLASPTFTGTPAAPTATAGTNTTQLATTAFVLANGGGATVNTGADASKGTGISGNVYLPNDGYYVYRSTGAAQVPWGPIFPLTPPSDASFAWINQGSATVSTTNGGVVLSVGAGAATQMRIRKLAAPGSTPYTVTAAFLASMATGDAQCGIVFRDSSNGKCITHSFESSSSSNLLSQHWTDATSVTDNVFQIFGTFGGPLIWLRVVDNGTNHLRQVSADGRTWQQITSTGRTAWTGAIDEVGFYVSTYSSSYPVAMTLLHWSVT